MAAGVAWAVPTVVMAHAAPASAASCAPVTQRLITYPKYTFDEDGQWYQALWVQSRDAQGIAAVTSFVVDLLLPLVDENVTTLPSPVLEVTESSAANMVISTSAPVLVEKVYQDALGVNGGPIIGN